MVDVPGPPNRGAGRGVAAVGVGAGRVGSRQVGRFGGGGGGSRLWRFETAADTLRAGLPGLAAVASPGITLDRLPDRVSDPPRVLHSFQNCRRKS